MIHSIDTNKFEFPGNYRAIVEDNEDPLDIGRVRVRIIGIHSIDPAITFTNTVVNIENIIGTQDKDIIIGNEKNNTLFNYFYIICNYNFL
jgi:hypothetical protein